jgi:nucleotide-binding universal stress UspA family protein
LVKGPTPRAFTKGSCGTAGNLTPAEISLPSYHHILAPLDGSDRAQAALPHAAAVAQRRGARLLLFSVVQSPLVAAPTLVDPVPGLAVPPASMEDAVNMAEEVREATVQYLDGHCRALEALEARPETGR